MKALYSTVFDLIVTKVNESIGASSSNSSSRSTTTSSGSIGVLDIFGFERFTVNSFEQLCINLTNEALQQQFNTFVFKNEQSTYEREGIIWKFIDFPDNEDVLMLINANMSVQATKLSIFSVLDEQCMVSERSEP